MMQVSPIEVTQLPHRIEPDPSRVIPRFFGADEAKTRRTIERVMSLSAEQVTAILRDLERDFSAQHSDITRCELCPSLSIDYMVWNITKDDIRVRMAIVDEDVWPPPATEKPQVPDPSLRVPYSDMIAGGRYDMKDVIQPTYDEVNKKYGLDEKQE